MSTEEEPFRAAGLGADPADDEGEGDSFLEEFVDGGAESDSGHDGLELDDAQADEIRNIFLTTLPQYVDPVADMIAQLFSSDVPDANLRSTLITTLDSIGTAAARIGVDDALIAITRLRTDIERIRLDAPVPPGLQDQIFEGLAGLRGLSGGDHSPDSRSSSRTLVAAFAQLDGLDSSVLERFSAAGLVTVDQLEMATLDEIVAVSGVSTSVVEELMAALGGGGRDGVRDRLDSATADLPSAAQTPDLPAFVEDPPDRHPQQEMPDSESKDEGLSALREELARRLRRQVDAEADVDELRVAIQRKRAGLIDLRRTQEAVEERRSVLQRDLADADTEVLNALSSMAEVRSQETALSRRESEINRAHEMATEQIVALERELRGIAEEQDEVAERLAQLAGRTRDLIKPEPSD